MASDNEKRSVVTDFGSRIEPKRKRDAKADPPAGKAASRARRADNNEAAPSPAPVAATRRPRARPSTTETPPVATAPRASEPVATSATVARPAPATAARTSRSLDTTPPGQLPASIIVHDEILGTADERLFMVRAPDSPQAAAFRVLRHQIEARSDAQVIAVTSPTSGTGTTTAAINLALALCECQRAQVLLVEGNTRSPALAKLLKFDPDPGFLTQMEQHRQSPGSKWHVTSFPIAGLHVMALERKAPAGPLVDGPAFRHAIEGLASGGFDRVVIDCASVLSGADVNLVQDAADGVLLVARARVTTNRELRDSIDRLSPSVILGTVLLGE